MLSVSIAVNTTFHLTVTVMAKMILMSKNLCDSAFFAKICVKRCKNYTFRIRQNVPLTLNLFCSKKNILSTIFYFFSVMILPPLKFYVVLCFLNHKA